MSDENESDLGAYFKDSIPIVPSICLSDLKDLSEYKDTISNAIKKTQKERTLSQVKSISSRKGEKSNGIRSTRLKNRTKKNVTPNQNAVCTKNFEEFVNNKAISDNSIQRNCSVVLTRIEDLQKSIRPCTKDDENALQLSSGSIKNKDKQSFELGLSMLTISNTSSEMSSIVPTEDRCKLASWGLPKNILEKYEARGVTSMFPWQVECLSCEKVIESKRNLVYSAPTSAGKTLVAEILLIKTILERRKKVIFVLPFVSVVREKMYYFQDLLSNSGIKVHGFMGGVAPAGGFTETQVAIATIEKANSLVNRLMEEGNLACLGSVIVDELHLIGDPNRGYLLELLLTKLKYMTLREDNINIQLIGMSATLPNLPVLAKWLDAEYYRTEFRPVPLNEQCKIGTNIYDADLQLIRTLIPTPELPTDEDNIFQLCMETITTGHSVLIFCPTKNWCEKLAQQIAGTFFKLGRQNTTLGEILKQQLNPTFIIETLEQLKRTPTGLDNVLKNTISFGVAFHHAGLTMEERDVVEGSFKSGVLRVLTATSTLSSGVNLPARRVIIRSPMFGGHILDTLTYKQMIGRAGRMGQDTAGESILICKPGQQSAVKSLLSASLDPIESCLETSGPFIRALLEAIASNVVVTSTDLDIYAKCTLVSFTETTSIDDPCKTAITYLTDNEFARSESTNEGSRWVATHLGKACLAASMHPKDGLFLFEELQKARKCLVLDTELHIVYLVTPVNSGSQIGTIDWMMFMELWRLLPDNERRVGQLVGVEDRFLMSAVKGIVRSGKSTDIHKRFYTAMALHDLVREVSLDEVCKRYGCCRGMLQTLQQSAATFAGMVTQFCKQLGWDCMELLIAQFQTRLQFGVRRELLDLLRLPLLDGIRARSLYKLGITCVADLAVANELDVEHALYKALPFKSEKNHGEDELKTVKKDEMKTVFISGKNGLTPHQAAVMLIQEARLFLQTELKLENIPWEQKNNSSSEDITNKSTKADKNISVASTSNVLGTTELTDCMNQPIQNKGVPLITTTQSASKVEQSEKLAPNTMVNDTEELVNTKHSKENLPSSDIKNNSVPKLVSAVQESKTEHGKNNEAISIYSPKATADDKHLKSRGNSALQFDSISSLLFESIQENIIINNSGKKCNNIWASTEKSNSNIFENDDFNDGGVAVNENNDVNIMTHSKRISDKENIQPVSPNLFDDSFMINTEMGNVLEQNIIDSLHISDFDEGCTAELKLLLANTSKKNLQTNPSVSATKVDPSEEQKKQHSSKFSVPNNPITQSKNIPLTWTDDSWNQSSGVLKKLGLLKQDRSNRNIKIKCNVKRNVNDTMNRYVALKSIQKISTRSKASQNEMDNSEEISIARKLNKDLPEGSPIANVVIYNNGRRRSIDSNKSDSDDMVVSSQVKSPVASVSRTPVVRSALKQRTPRLNIITNNHESAKSSVNEGILKRKISTKKPGLRDILPRSIAAFANCDVNSIASNSDEDIPTKKMKIVHTPKFESIADQKSSPKNVNPSEQKAHINSRKPKTIVANLINSDDVNVVKVAKDKKTFATFKRDVMRKKRIALALHCESFANENEVNIIGTKIVRASTSERKKKTRKSLDNFVHGNKRINGIMISWENNVAYYMSFDITEDSVISIKDKFDVLKRLLSKTALFISCFATKDVYKMLYRCCTISSNCRFLDPKTAHWMLCSDTTEKSFEELVSLYIPYGISMMERIDPCHGTVGPGLCIRSSSPGETRALVEVILTWQLMNVLLIKLDERNPMLRHVFEEVEMRTISVLACMELNGMGMCQTSLQTLSSVIDTKISSLEERAYTLAGRRFNFSSAKDVAMILGLYRGKKVSTNKAVLQQCDDPISNLIMLWRKLNSIRVKIVYPLLNLAQHNHRVYGVCVTYTHTGRISMHEPNLQNVPKDFNSDDKGCVISVRSAFVPAVGNVLLSADYCQLELRILAHFAKDRVLCEAMQRDGDVFKSIAAKWNHVTEKEVNDTMRQRTKQLCYAMIYGMGVRSLAETLSVEESEAREFLETFMNTYPGIRQWLTDVLEEARKKGYVTTLMGRQRILPGLSSQNPTEKSQSERQAINTKVQGSAADIAKKAMILVADIMRREFPDAPVILPITSNKQKLKRSSKDSQIRGGYLVLQLHDELLYEVNVSDLERVASIVKESMEEACRISVPLPVKIKVGRSWGELLDSPIAHCDR